MPPSGTTSRRDQEREAFRPGEAWDNFIVDLKCFYEDDLGRKATVTKEPIKEESPFVLFVMAVQKEFPKKFRRHNKDYDTLAKAIADVLRGSRAPA